LEYAIELMAAVERFHEILSSLGETPVLLPHLGIVFDVVVEGDIPDKGMVKTDILFRKSPCDRITSAWTAYTTAKGESKRFLPASFTTGRNPPQELARHDVISGGYLDFTETEKPAGSNLFSLTAMDIHG